MNPGSGINGIAQNRNHLPEQDLFFQDIEIVGNGLTSGDSHSATVQSTSKNHVLLNDNFDFVLSTSPSKVGSPTFQNNSGSREGTLIDLVDDNNHSSINGAVTIVDTFEYSNLPVNVGHLVDTRELTAAPSQEDYSNARDSDDEEEVLCVFSSGGSEQHQPLQLGDESTSNQQFDAMDRESEPLISLSSGRGRLGSTDVAVTIGAPGKDRWQSTPKLL